MKSLFAVLLLLLSSNLVAQDDKSDDRFKIKGFYAHMPMDEMRDVAASHGALLLKEEDDGWLRSYYLDCEETEKEHRTRTSGIQDEQDAEARQPSDWSFCWRYSLRKSNLTLGGFSVYSVTLETNYGPPDFHVKLSFKLPPTNVTKLFERLSNRFGKPDAVSRILENEVEALWSLGKAGDVEYGLEMKTHNDPWAGYGYLVNTGTAEVYVNLIKRNPTAAEQYKEAREKEANEDF